MRAGFPLLQLLGAMASLLSSQIVQAQPGASAGPPRGGLSVSGWNPSQNWPYYTLKAERTWQLNSPDGTSFQASGLLLTPEGDLLTVADSGPTLHRIQFRAGAYSADLIPLPDLFTSDQLAPFRGEKVGKYDCEGIAQDDQGRLYLCEESNRWILRCDPKTKTVERLNIDWSPVRKYFHPTDRNASFEGIAIGHGRLYVANERQRGRIIVVDLKTLRVMEDFAVRPKGSTARDVDYSDLSWFEDALWVLLRESRCVLKVDPAKHHVLAEFNYRDMESSPDVVYYTRYPTGVMEGLAVDHDAIWLVTDNNGLGLVSAPRDTRPTLFKCQRPDRKPEEQNHRTEAGQQSK